MSTMATTIFFDAEFTGLVPNTTLISIGMVTESNEKFYAEFTDYDKSQVTQFIKEEIISNLIFNDRKTDVQVYEHKVTTNDFSKGDMFTRGNSETIVHNLTEWLHQFSPNKIQLVGDVCHYDMTLLCNLFGGAMSLPYMINPVCYDICQDICARMEGKSMVDLHLNNMESAFDLSREYLCMKLNNEKLPKGKKHNALYDAMVCKMIYEGMRRS